MSNETETPKPDYNGQRTVLLKGGQPDTKPIPYKPIQPRQPQLSNRDDMAAIHNSHTRSRNLISLCESLQRLLVANPSYVGVASEFLSKLAEEIENPTEPNAA